MGLEEWVDLKLSFDKGICVLKENSKRMLRVNQLVRKELSFILHNELDDPRLRFLSVIGVFISPDLKTANIGISHLNDQVLGGQLVDSLNSRAGYIRSLLGKRIRIKSTPALSFHYDHSIEEGARMMSLLRAVEDGDKG